MGFELFVGENGEKPKQVVASLTLGRFHVRLEMCCAYSLSRVRLLVTPWTVARQAPLSMGYPRQEYWGGLPFPSPGDLPNILRDSNLGTKTNP